MLTASTPTSSSSHGADPTNSAEVSSEEYESLARAMLDIPVSDVEELKAAMWRVIASAPIGVNVARLLALTMTRLQDRAIRYEVTPIPRGRNTACRALPRGSELSREVSRRLQDRGICRSVKTINLRRQCAPARQIRLRCH
jgi:hypothetical protein